MTSLKTLKMADSRMPSGTIHLQTIKMNSKMLQMTQPRFSTQKFVKKNTSKMMKRKFKKRKRKRRTVRPRSK